MNGGQASRAQRVRELLAAGDLARARATAQQAMASSPRDPTGPLLMSEVTASAGEFTQAEFFARRAHALAPRDWAVAANLAQVLTYLRRSAEAASLLAGLDGVHGQFAPHHLAVGNALVQEGRACDAEDRARAGLGLDARHPDLWVLLASSVLAQGRASEAVAAMRRAIELAPDHPMPRDGLCFMLNYDPSADPAEVLAAHRAYGDLLARLTPSSPVPRHPEKPGGVVRVGLLSPDFRAHSVASFVEPLLRHADRSRVEIRLYHANALTDATTTRLAGLADGFRQFTLVSDQGIAAAMRQDAVDVGVDLAGHTQGHCLGAMQARTAPVQATAIGYPNTTGVATIDARLVDSATDPPGAEAFATERLIRLDPIFLCYQPPTEHDPGEPGPAALPSEAAGSVTFGSFNAVPKISDATVTLWARVLSAVPGSRLLLKGQTFADARVREGVRQRFERAGIDPTRVEALAFTASLREHLSLYGRVDVGLDPTPYNGTTTTAEALWMGVPVVTLRGRTHAGRVAASILSAVGLPELIAEDAEGYVRIARDLAMDTARRRGVRASLRGRLLASALCDAPGYARRFADAMVTLHRGTPA